MADLNLYVSAGLSWCYSVHSIWGAP